MVAAERALQAIAAERIAHGTHTVERRWYFCQTCSWYHLTKKAGEHEHRG
jgi:hypothetical protein